jgi:hypothetical protein
LHEVVVHVGEDGVINLNDEASIADGAIVLAERVGNGVDVVFFARVILVDAVPDGAGGRNDRKKRLLDLDSAEGGFQVVDVALHGRGIGVLDRADANVGGHTGKAPGEFGLHHIRKALEVAPEPSERSSQIRAVLEARDTFEDVIRPTGFAEFAVVNDVDAGLGLPLDDIGDGIGERVLKFPFVFRRRGRQGHASQLAKARRTDDAADVGSKNPMFAAFHGIRIGLRLLEAIEMHEFVKSVASVINNIGPERQG